MFHPRVSGKLLLNTEADIWINICLPLKALFTQALKLNVFLAFQVLLE